MDLGVRTRVRDPRGGGPTPEKDPSDVFEDRSVGKGVSHPTPVTDPVYKTRLNKVDPFSLLFLFLQFVFYPKDSPFAEEKEKD